MTISQTLRLVALGGCAALALAACAPGESPAQSGSAPGGTRTVTIGLTYIPNIQFAPVYVADAQGMYNDAGVTASIRHHGSHEGFFTALFGERKIRQRPLSQARLRDAYAFVQRPRRGGFGAAC